MTSESFLLNWTFGKLKTAGWEWWIPRCHQLRSIENHASFTWQQFMLRIMHSNVANGILLLQFLISAPCTNVAEQKSSCTHILSCQKHVFLSDLQSGKTSWQYYKLLFSRFHITLLQLAIFHYRALYILCTGKLSKRSSVSYYYVVQNFTPIHYFCHICFWPQSTGYHKDF